MTQSNTEWMSNEQSSDLLGAITLDTMQGFTAPYRHFKGTLVDIKIRYKPLNNEKNTVLTTVGMFFGAPDFEMISCTQLWEQPNCILEMDVFNIQQIFSNSPMGLLNESIKQCLGGEQGIKIMEQKGKHFEIMYTKGHMLNSKDKDGTYKDMLLDGFQVVAINSQRNPDVHEPAFEGATVSSTPVHQPSGANGAMDHMEMLRAILNGKTLNVFNSEAFALPWVQSNPELFNLFASGTINRVVGSWVAEGKVSTVGEGDSMVYNKV